MCCVLGCRKRHPGLGLLGTPDWLGPSAFPVVVSLPYFLPGHTLPAPKYRMRRESRGSEEGETCPGHPDICHVGMGVGIRDPAGPSAPRVLSWS